MQALDPQVLSSALAVLTAMITPAVLISACGTLILSTSNRLGRVVDRVRELSGRIEELDDTNRNTELLEERRAMFFTQLDKLIARANILQRSLTTFYLSVGIFVSTSVSIGIVAVSGTRYSWIPVILALVGAGFLFYGSVLLIFEARLALASLRVELDFTWRLGQLHAPADLRKEKQ